MSTFGQQTFLTVGRSIKVSADGTPLCKQGGISIDWSLVAAVAGSDVTLEDGVTVKVGEKYLRYGQVVCAVTSGGKYAGYDPAASNGQEILANGRTFVLDTTVKENDRASDHGGVAIYGGLVHKARLLATAGTHSLAAGPTYTELLAAMPQLQFADDI
jgi:hypothetical protein